jgi:hypothetical protein
MFDSAFHFNQPLDNWNINNVINFKNMFNYAVSFNQDLSTWDMTHVSGNSRVGMFNHTSMLTNFKPKFNKNIF